MPKITSFLGCPQSPLRPLLSYYPLCGFRPGLTIDPLTFRRLGWGVKRGAPPPCRTKAWRKGTGWAGGSGLGKSHSVYGGCVSLGLRPRARPGLSGKGFSLHPHPPPLPVSSLCPSCPCPLPCPLPASLGMLPVHWSDCSWPYPNPPPSCTFPRDLQRAAVSPGGLGPLRPPSS